MNRVGLTTFVTSAVHWSPGQAPPLGCLVAPLAFMAPAGRLSETVIAFARSCSCGIETVIAFVGAKWVFLVQFSGAEVMPVSMVAVQGRAVVLSVSKSPRCRSSCAKKFARRGLMCA